MGVYVRIEDGVVVEVINGVLYETPDENFRKVYGEEPYQAAMALAGHEVPMEHRFSAEFLADLIEVSETEERPSQGWLFDGTSFMPPEESY